MKGSNRHACDAWQLLVQLSSRSVPTCRRWRRPSALTDPVSRAEIDRAGRPVPMGQLAKRWLRRLERHRVVDRLESRGRASGPSEETAGQSTGPHADRRPASHVLLERMTTPPATLERLSIEEQRTLVRILARLLE